MFKPNTLFIVGAGASAEFGLPVGKSLIQNIARLYNFKFELGSYKGGSDNDFYYRIERHFRQTSDGDTLNRHLKIALDIANGVIHDNSIDSFMYKHKESDEIQFLSKLAIVRSILQSEHKSKLYVDRTASRSGLEHSKIKDTWIEGFFGILQEEVTKSNLRSIFNNISIISFNYDRCIPHYLSYRIQELYRLDKSEADQIVQSLKIFYPYGNVGELDFPGTQNGVPFGTTDTNRLVELARGIKTFNEQTNDQNLQTDIHQKIKNAKNIVFLGFGFHKQNLEILTEPNCGGSRKTIFATAFGISDEDLQEVGPSIAKIYSSHKASADALKGAFDSEIRIKNKKNGNGYKCSDLFNDFKFGLSN